jgi:hypothetical protein
MKFGGCGRSDVLEEARLGLSTWGDIVLLFGETKGMTKHKSEMNCTVALDGHKLTN